MRRMRAAPDPPGGGQSGRGVPPCRQRLAVIRLPLAQGREEPPHILPQRRARVRQGQPDRTLRRFRHRRRAGQVVQPLKRAVDLTLEVGFVQIMIDDPVRTAGRGSDRRAQGLDQRGVVAATEPAAAPGVGKRRRPQRQMEPGQSLAITEFLQRWRAPMGLSSAR